MNWKETLLGWEIWLTFLGRYLADVFASSWYIVVPVVSVLVFIVYKLIKK